MTQGSIRRARPEDVEEIVLMVRELAEFEQALDEAVATVEQFHAALFGPQPKVFAHVVDEPTPDGRRLGGFAMWFLNFSTWVGKHGLYLEDLYVRPELRGRGYGKALLATLAKECVDNDYGRFEWWVLDWNTSALDVYRAIGAEPMDEWTVQRVAGDALRALAAQAPAQGAITA